MKLHYAGTGPVTLPLQALELTPGDEVDLPGEIAARFIDRPDFEPVDAPAEEQAAEIGEVVDGAQPDAPATGAKRRTKAASTAVEVQSTDETRTAT